jgi:hypothetical protein
MTTSTDDSMTTAAHADPHGLGTTPGEALADEPELHLRFGVRGKWLRHLRRQKKVRYIDLSPDQKPGVGAPTRYLYCVRDVAAVLDAERARVEAAREVERARQAAPSAPAEAPTPKPPPKPVPPPPAPPPLAAHARATRRGKAPEVIVRRRAS